MISFLKGFLMEQESNQVVLNVNNVGFCITVPSSDLMEISQCDEVSLHTYLHVREDSMELYGSVSKDTMFVFKKLIDVSGIGPKGAMNILSSMPSQELIKAIIREDTTSLSKCPGVGKKTAERMVLELKDKFKNVSRDESPVSCEIPNSIKDEAIEALMNLGYKKFDATRRAEAAYREELELEEIIRIALKE